MSDHGAEVTGVSCGSCGLRLQEAAGLPVVQRQPCPRCGSLSRQVAVELRADVRSAAALSFAQRRPGFPGILLKAVERWKVSALGRPAHERLIVDRSDPAKTVKRHFVEEMQPDGSWKPVPGHDPEIVEWPAKTPPRSGDQ